MDVMNLLISKDLYSEVKELKFDNFDLLGEGQAGNEAGGSGGEGYFGGYGGDSKKYWIFQW